MLRLAGRMNAGNGFEQPFSVDPNVRNIPYEETILHSGRNEALLARRASEDRRENPRLRVGLTCLKASRSKY